MLPKRYISILLIAVLLLIPCSLVTGFVAFSVINARNPNVEYNGGVMRMQQLRATAGDVPCVHLANALLFAILFSSPYYRCFDTMDEALAFADEQVNGCRAGTIPGWMC